MSYKCPKCKKEKSTEGKCYECATGSPKIELKSEFGKVTVTREILSSDKLLEEPTIVPTVEPIVGSTSLCILVEVKPIFIVTADSSVRKSKSLKLLLTVEAAKQLAQDILTQVMK
jgi:hypothetical protein